MLHACEQKAFSAAKTFDVFRKKKGSFQLSKSSHVHSNTKKTRCQSLKFSIRCYHVAAIYGFALAFMVNLHRINIGVALLKMVNTTSQFLQNVTGDCPLPDQDYNMERNQFAGDFNWSPDIQGYVMSAGHLGYVIPQIPAGRFAEKFGSKLVLLSGLLCASFANILSPWASRLDVTCLIGVQVVKGIALGVISPAMSCFMANWFPGPVRRFLLSFVYAGFSLGACVGAVSSGVLCDLPFLGGWPLAFYFSGAVGCLLCIYLVLFMYETPQMHPYIEESELKYLCEQTKRSCSSEEQLKLPWTKVLFSGPSLAVFYACFGQFWMQFHFLGIYSSYLGNILHYPIVQNGVLTSVPFILQAVTSCLSSYFSDALRRSKGLSVDFIRKGNNTISCIAYAACMAGIYFAGCDKTLNISFYMMAMAFSGFALPGCVTAPVDMSPNFAGTLTGVASCLASTSGFIAPLVVGYFTQEQQSIEQWQKVFLTSILVISSSGVVFQLFGSAEVQPWDGSHNRTSIVTEGVKAKETKSFTPDLGQLPITIHL